MKPELNIIAKKIKGFNGNRNGLIKPLFEVDETNNLRVIESKEYPNTGYIFIADYELLNSDLSSEVFLMENCFFVGDDNLYPERQEDPSSCQKRINYNTRISNYFISLPPNQFIPIYQNDFDIEKSRLFSTEGILSTIFFLKDTKTLSVFGPFERDSYDLKAANFYNYDQDFENDNLYKEFIEFYSDYDGHIIYKIDALQIQPYTITDDKRNEYVRDFYSIAKKNIGDQIEYTPITILHQWAIEKIKRTSEITSSTLNQIRNIESTITTPLDQLRWKRYLALLNQVETSNKIIDDLAKTLYQNGYENITVEDSALESVKKELDSLKEDINTKSNEIVKLKDEREELASLLSETAQKKSDIVDPNMYPNIYGLLLKQSEDSLRDFDGIIAENKDLKSLSADIQRLEFKKEYLEGDIKKLEESKRKIEESVRLIKQNFDNDVAVHTAKLADAKMYTDLLNGISINPNNYGKEKVKTNVKQISSLPAEINNSRAYILEIQKRLKSLNREMSFNEVANLVVTINQSFLTIIAGAPGVGKTSLVSKLSSCMGLSDELGYLEINCAKGWTSAKDILGFFNPLTGRYQDAKTQLKAALEKSELHKKSPYVVLLDEANLSPMEHYWSDFIKLSDVEYERVIKLSSDDVISFGEGFRFIATINHDHTTEALSNRLLDRAAIIQIDRPPHILENLSSNEAFEQIFDYYEIQKLFSETLKWKSDEELIKKFFNHVRDKIEANSSGIIISPRKELAIKRYCKVATGLLDGNTYTALDYAVSQHILPLISGRGEGFESMLKLVRADLNDKGMVKSERILNKILEKGKELKHFKYIYY